MAYRLSRPSARYRRAGAVVLTGLVVLPAVLPGSGVPARAGLVDDVVLHGVAGAILAIGYAVAINENRAPSVVLGSAFLLSVVVGAGIELVQASVPGRTPAGPDLLGHTVGSALAIVAYRLAHPVIQWN
ncbi:MAG: hypothetical protein ABEJ35_04580 [Halobacteriaceae archaeon]